MASSYVMIVEDNNQLARMYKKVLNHAGYETLHTDTAREAIQLFIQHAPGVICLDWRLTDGNCTPFLKYLQEIDWSQHPYIIVISAEVTAHDIEPFQDVVAEYYAKPISMKEIVGKVAQIFDNQHN